MLGVREPLDCIQLRTKTISSDLAYCKTVFNRMHLLMMVKTTASESY